jgi:hypothetical protein
MHDGVEHRSGLDADLQQINGEAQAARSDRAASRPSSGQNFGSMAAWRSDHGQLFVRRARFDGS